MNNVEFDSYIQDLARKMGDPILFSDKKNKKEIKPIPLTEAERYVKMCKEVDEFVKYYMEVEREHFG